RPPGALERPQPVIPATDSYHELHAAWKWFNAAPFSGTPGTAPCGSGAIDHSIRAEALNLKCFEARCPTQMDKSTVAARESGLSQALTRSQVIMIGLGGAIGTGLFMGSCLAIGYAGPAVVISFAIAALAAVAIVFSLSEMAVVHPTAGSFGTYAEIYLSPWAGFIVRYAYWMAQVIAIGAEAVATGVYMTFWLPDTPVWMWSVGFALVLLYFNSRSVNNFGSIEYWFAMIKVVAIVMFIVL